MRFTKVLYKRPLTFVATLVIQLLCRVGPRVLKASIGPGMNYFCFNSQRQETLSQVEVMMRQTYAQKADLRPGKSNLDLRYGQS